MTRGELTAQALRAITKDGLIPVRVTKLEVIEMGILVIDADGKWLPGPNWNQQLLNGFWLVIV